MTEEQLQLLRSLRPHGQDEHEVGVAEARAAADHAGLSDHLDDELQTDLAMRSALGKIEPPDGLEDALKNAMRAARNTCEPPAELRESVISAIRHTRSPQPIARHSRRSWLGLGAGIAASIAIGGKWWWDFRAFTLDRFTREFTAVTRYGISLALMSMDKVAVEEWLIANHAPRLKALPKKLDALPRKGCHLYDIDGNPVSLECFLLPEMQQLHLYSTPSAGLMNPPPAGAPVKIVRDGDLTLATWAQEEQTLLLISHESPELILDLVG